MTQYNSDKTTELENHVKSNFDGTVQQLIDYLKIPAISCDPDHFADVHKLAEVLAVDLKEKGFEDARVEHIEGTLPIVVGSDMSAGPDAPTVLIYGHFDLQPVKGEVWDSDPHEGVIRNGRLYARGSADDMGGWVSHLAAIEAYRATGTALASA